MVLKNKLQMDKSPKLRIIKIKGKNTECFCYFVDAKTPLNNTPRPYPLI